MRARLICLFVSAITAASSIVDAGGPMASEQTADAATPTLPMLQLNTLVQNGRPSDFYQLVVDERPNVCDALNKALSKPHSATAGRGKDPGRDLLLGTGYSIGWDELKDDMGHPVSRADIDLNNDERMDTVYRIAGVLGGPYLYDLVLTTGHPVAEAFLNRDRRQQISGAPLQDPKWGGIPENIVFFTGPRSMDSPREPIETIHPPLPAGVTLPLGVIIDVVLVSDRHYVLIGPAYYTKEVPIKLFVFETRAPRDHSLLCYFESNFALQKP